jgi:hypothetical protein
MRRFFQMLPAVAVVGGAFLAGSVWRPTAEAASKPQLLGAPLRAFFIDGVWLDRDNSRGLNYHDGANFRCPPR